MSHQIVSTDRFYHVYRVGKDLAPEEFIKARTTGNHPYKCFDTLEETIIAILSINRYEDLPRNINIDYKDFLGGPVPLREIVNMLRTAVACSSNRFGRGYETVKINCRIGKPISPEFSDYLKKIGVDNLTPTPSYWGADVWLKFADRMGLGNTVWPEFLINGTDGIDVCSVLRPEVRFDLTPRQKEITELIVKRGLSNKQIANQLRVSESAVKLHVGSVLKKLGLKNRTQLSRALSEGLNA